MKNLINKLEKTRSLQKEEWLVLFDCNEKERAYLFKKARQTRDKVYGKTVFVRGLIEISNYCKNDCFYCGIRHSNKKAMRYRLTPEEILTCCKEGYKLGFRTFVLQGGEDPYFTDELLCGLISEIKKSYPDCAVTLSLGERSRESYEMLKKAGADRYLLRHETASCKHYETLHPKEMLFKTRKECLYNLKELGFQVGAGMMVGSPFQTKETLAEDMLFLQELKPHMVGIGPFISHQDTPFREEPNGSVDTTILLLALTRMLLPNVLLPATTALGTLDPQGREKAVLAGANVVMPNLSPLSVREKYMLYDGKISTGDEAAESLEHLKKSMKKIGYEVVVDRGDYKEIK